MTDDDKKALIARKGARIPGRWLDVLIDMIESACARSQDIDYGIISEMVLWIFLNEPEVFDSKTALVGCMKTKHAS